MANGVSIAWGTAWVPTDRVSGFRQVAEITGCFALALKAKRIQLLKRKFAKGVADKAGREEVEILGVPRKSPIIRIQAVIIDRNYEPTIASDTRYDARRVELFIDNPSNCARVEQASA